MPILMHPLPSGLLRIGKRCLVLFPTENKVQNPNKCNPHKASSRTQHVVHIDIPAKKKQQM